MDTHQVLRNRQQADRHHLIHTYYWHIVDRNHILQVKYICRKTKKKQTRKQTIKQLLIKINFNLQFQLIINNFAINFAICHLQKINKFKKKQKKKLQFLLSNEIYVVSTPVSTSQSTVFPLPGTFPWAHSGRGKPRRGMMRRAVFSDLQRKGLERRFQIQKYISKPDRKKLAEKLGLKDSQVSLIVNVSILGKYIINSILFIYLTGWGGCFSSNFL